MPYSLSLVQQQKQTQSLKQMQRLMMSSQMQQALHLLQLPIMELSATLETELEQNPVLDTSEEDSDSDSAVKQLEQENTETNEDPNSIPEKEVTFDDRDFDVMRQLDEEFRDYFKESGPSKVRTQEDSKLRTYLESSIQEEISLFDHLMQQARETFSNPDDLKIAEEILGSLDEKGYLLSSLDEISQQCGFPENNVRKVLKEIHTFEPYGVGATSVQEALLIQLRCQGHPKTLAYKIIDHHYDDLLHNRIPVIQKGLGCTVEDIATAIREDIAKLDLHPGMWYSRIPVQPLIPDVTIILEGETLQIVVNEDTIPSFRVNHKYLKMLEDDTLPKETKDFIREKLASAKWLLRNIHTRKNTLQRIAEVLIEKQQQFFNDPQGQLTPLTMKVVSEQLEMHESTIARAVSNKYIDTPRGIFPLRHFFTNAYQTQEGEDISSDTVRQHLVEIIKFENKRKPFSDEAIAAQIKAKGIPCARRTVAKYRALLNIGNAHQRKQYGESGVGSQESGERY